MQRSISPFWFFAVPVSWKFYPLLQFLRYRDAVCGILLTAKLATKRWEQMFEFSPQNYFRAFQSKKNLKKKKTKIFIQNVNIIPSIVEF